LYINTLHLTNFRNYKELSFDVPCSVSVFWGNNAQGKTNLLESICFLATTRFSRRVPDREIMNWHSLADTIAFARVAADVVKAERNISLEIILRPRSLAFEDTGPSALNKQTKVNAIGRKAVDYIGQLNTVMFSPRDIDLITEEPSLRRRYLDITNSQIDRSYLRGLQRYNKVLSRRNHLLRHIAAGHSRPDELQFWDEELIANGAYLIYRRKGMLAALQALAEPIHDELSAGKEKLALEYVCSLMENQEAGPEDIEKAFGNALASQREKEILRGQSLIGPHRDDLKFLINGIDMGSYGSRGQQRTIALSIRLAEAEFMMNQTGQAPVLLLDDVLSELDAQRRRHLLSKVTGYEQVLITSTDLDHFPGTFLDHGEVFEVSDGKIVS